MCHARLVIFLQNARLVIFSQSILITSLLCCEWSCIILNSLLNVYGDFGPRREWKFNRFKVFIFLFFFCLSPIHYFFSLSLLFSISLPYSIFFSLLLRMYALFLSFCPILNNKEALRRYILRRSCELFIHFYILIS